jgi:hypothetical protein
MSEADGTGYGESSDTGDGPVAQDQATQGDGSGDGSGEGAEVTLTTDEDAQDDDSVLRPGNDAG